MGGITIMHDEGEQVLSGVYKGIQILVLSVNPDEESASVCWKAACGLVDTKAFDVTGALIIDIAKATVRHGYITEMP